MKIGKALSDKTTKRVIVLIFSVMVSIPFFTVETWMQSPDSAYTGANYLYKVLYSQSDDEYNYGSKHSDIFKFLLNDYIEFHKNLDRYPLIYLNLTMITGA